MQRILQTLYRILSSRRFGVFLIGFFVFEALWIVFSGVYPLAFDEEFHWGIIRFYSDHWLPFISSQPAGSGEYGPIIADPSYLFHYLMSFPYRVLHFFIKSDTALIIILRIMNVAMFAGGLALFYKVLRRVGSSRLLTNGAMALFVLIPIAPLLAAHINYDNLMMLLVAWSVWLVLDVRRDLQTRTINLKTYVTLIVVMMCAALVKYAFLPIDLAIALYVVYQLWRAFRGRGKQFGPAVAKGYRALSTAAKLGLLAVFVVSGLLFAQRYVANVVRYHTPLPECSQVIGTKECLLYGPWARDYHYAQDKTANFKPDVWHFTRTWFGGMYRRMFFVIAGKTRGYQNYPPLPVVGITAIVLAVIGVLALIFFWRRVFAGHPELYFLLLVTLVYSGMLWIYGLQDYITTGRPVAINGRYLLMILFPFMAVVGRALAIALHQWRAARTLFVTLAILLFLQGGGIISFIVRSNERWYWPGNDVVLHINNGARHILKPLIIEGKDSPNN